MKVFADGMQIALHGMSVSQDLFHILYSSRHSALFGARFLQSCHANILSQFALLITQKLDIHSRGPNLQ